MGNYRFIRNNRSVGIRYFRTFAAWTLFQKIHFKNSKITILSKTKNFKIKVILSFQGQ